MSFNEIGYNVEITTRLARYLVVVLTELETSTIIEATDIDVGDLGNGITSCKDII